jgi:hypothetical protein
MCAQKKPYLSREVLDDDLYLPTVLPPHDPDPNWSIQFSFPEKYLA